MEAVEEIDKVDAVVGDVMEGTGEGVAEFDEEGFDGCVME